jgi:hypothetical protein
MMDLNKSHEQAQGHNDVVIVSTGEQAYDVMHVCTGSSSDPQKVPTIQTRLHWGDSVSQKPKPYIHFNYTDQSTLTPV